jgi:hypothetical protein
MMDNGRLNNPPIYIIRNSGIAVALPGGNQLISNFILLSQKLLYPTTLMRLRNSTLI